jgi:hypothetical protein
MWQGWGRVSPGADVGGVEAESVPVQMWQGLRSRLLLRFLPAARIELAREDGGNGREVLDDCERRREVARRVGRWAVLEDAAMFNRARCAQQSLYTVRSSDFALHALI